MNEKEFKAAFEKTLPKKTSDKIADLNTAITEALKKAKEESDKLTGDGVDAVKVPIDNEREAFTAEHKKVKDAKVTPAEKKTSLQEVYKGVVRHLKRASEAQDLIADRKKVADKAVQLKKLLDDNGGDPKELDKLVNQARKKPTDPDNHVLMRAAMVARYDLETFDAPMTEKAIPKLYDILALVPESHVKNPMLKNIGRLKVNDSSFYSEDRKEIVLTIKRSSGIRDTDLRSADGDILPTFVEYFKETTLHEVGHAVDADKKFMENRRGDATYGGWEERKVGVVADKIIEHTKLEASFPHIAPGHLKALVQNALTNGVMDISALSAKSFENPKAVEKALDDLVKDKAAYDKAESLVVRTGPPPSDMTPEQVEQRSKEWGVLFREFGAITRKRDAVGEMYGAVLNRAQGSMEERIKEVREWIAADNGRPADTDQAKLQKHAATKYALAIRLKSESSGLWDSGASGAKKWALGTEVYQESYKGKWTSYLLAARAATSISSYQFRADGEWFAELYGAAYSGSLPRSHSAWAWMKTDDIADYDKIAARKSKKK